MQGDELSCLLFNIALEGVIRDAGLDHDIRDTILYRSLQFPGFTNDIDIIGRTTAKVCEAYTRLKREAARIGLRINATKTKYLLVGDSDHLGSSVLLDGDSLHRLLRSRRLRSRTICEIYRTLIRPVVLYGHESWTIRAEDANALGVFERRILRAIFGD